MKTTEKLPKAVDVTCEMERQETTEYVAQGERWETSKVSNPCSLDANYEVTTDEGHTVLVCGQHYALLFVGAPDEVGPV